MQFKGATYHYLEHGTGKATLNILSMARPEIAFELRDAINKAFETNLETSKAGIEIKSYGTPYTLAIDVIPLKTESEEKLLLIIFTALEQVEKKDSGHA